MMNIKEQVKKNLKVIFVSKEFKNFIEGKKIENGKCIIIGNSFFKREDSKKIKKSSKYLCVLFNKNDKNKNDNKNSKKIDINFDDIKIVNSDKLKIKNFKIESVKKLRLDNLDDQIKNELNEFGKLSFIFIKPMREKKDTYEIDLTKSNNGKRNKKSLLDIFIENLKNENEEFEKLLKNSEKSNNISTDILRISYNFIDDYGKILKIIRGLCDLKPIILWMIIDKFFQLENDIREAINVEKEQNLQDNQKVKLKDFEDLIKKARNAKMHKAIKLNKEVKIKLGSEIFNDVELRILAEYEHRKKKNELTYREKAFIDLLKELTHTKGENRSKEFWKSVFKVQKKTQILLESLKKSLEILEKYQTP